MYNNTLQFSNLSDIKFECASNEIKIIVSGNVLGIINRNYPITLFITENGSSKAITLKQISNSEYLQNNTNNLLTDTIAFNYANLQGGLHIDSCTGSTNKYKVIGWEDESLGQSCTGSSGCDCYFDICATLNFKAKIEMTTMGSITQLRLIVRYESNVNVQAPIGTALCNTGLYCYCCR